MGIGYHGYRVPWVLASTCIVYDQTLANFLAPPKILGLARWFSAEEILSSYFAIRRRISDFCSSFFVCF
jgi:hypothetical protein